MNTMTDKELNERVCELVAEHLAGMNDHISEAIANQLTETDTFKSILDGIQNWVCNDVAAEIERWIIKVYTPVMLEKLSTKIDTNAIVKELQEYFDCQENDETEEPASTVGKIYAAE